MRSKLINILIVVAAAVLWPSVVLAQNNTNAAAELMRAQREGRTTGMDQAGANPFSQQQYDERRMLEQPAESDVLFRQYGVTHAYISSHERSQCAVDEDWFRANGKLIFSEGDVSVYALN